MGSQAPIDVYIRFSVESLARHVRLRLEQRLAKILATPATEMHIQNSVQVVIIVSISIIVKVMHVACLEEEVCVSAACVSITTESIGPQPYPVCVCVCVYCVRVYLLNCT